MFFLGGKYKSTLVFAQLWEITFNATFQSYDISKFYNK